MPKKVLIVEDNAPTRQLISSLVKASGHAPIEASDGYRALDLVKQHEIDAALLVQYMEPMGGFELAKRLGFEGIKVPMILITAHEKSDILIEAKDKGFLAVMKKPIDSDRLVKTLERLLR